MQALSSVQGYLMFVVWTNDTPMPSNVLQSEIKITFHLLMCFIEHCTSVSWDFAIWRQAVYFLLSKTRKLKAQVPYNNSLSDLACWAALGDIALWSFLYGPCCGQSLLSQAGVTVPVWPSHSVSKTWLFVLLEFALFVLPCLLQNVTYLYITFL